MEKEALCRVFSVWVSARDWPPVSSQFFENSYEKYDERFQATPESIIIRFIDD